jgi:hypothetical protein
MIMLVERKYWIINFKWVEIITNNIQLNNKINKLIYNIITINNLLIKNEKINYIKDFKIIFFNHIVI